MNIANNLKLFSKYLDQPALVKKIHSLVPYALTAGAAGYGIYDTLKAPEEERKHKLVQNASVLSFTVVSALIAARGLKIRGKQIFEGFIELPHLHKHDIEEVLGKIKGNNPAKELIDNVKNGKVLKFSEVKNLNSELEKIHLAGNLLDKIIPGAHSHGPFEELKKLSLLGLMPVAGGVTGGIIGDKATGNDWREKLPNKLKEASYQYLSNIFLCNVGAGVALAIMNRMKVKSRAAKFAGVMAGVALVGIVAGNKIANLFGKNVLDPVLHRCVHHKSGETDCERHPELLDIGLHADDMASAGFLSGLKWIGPVLPVMYSVSAYRAGIGYRNGDKPSFRANA